MVVWKHFIYFANKKDRTVKGFLYLEDISFQLGKPKRLLLKNKHNQQIKLKFKEENEMDRWKHEISSCSFRNYYQSSPLLDIKPTPTSPVALPTNIDYFLALSDQEKIWRDFLDGKKYIVLWISNPSNIKLLIDFLLLKSQFPSPLGTLSLLSSSLPPFPFPFPFPPSPFLFPSPLGTPSLLSSSLPLSLSLFPFSFPAFPTFSLLGILFSPLSFLFLTLLPFPFLPNILNFLFLLPFPSFPVSVFKYFLPLHSSSLPLMNISVSSYYITSFLLNTTFHSLFYSHTLLSSPTLFFPQSIPLLRFPCTICEHLK